MYSAKHARDHSSNSSTISALDAGEGLSPGKKKVHFARDGKENRGRDSVSSIELTLRKRLQQTTARAQALGEREGTYLKSRQFLGIR